MDGEYDAAEIDRELISTRLKQDVLDNSGKIHLFVADSVRSFVHIYIYIRCSLFIYLLLFLISDFFFLLGRISSLISLDLQVLFFVHGDTVFQ